MSRVIGIDPGSEVTGYGVIDTDGARHVAVEFAGIEASPRRLSFPERLLVISRKLEEVMERVRPTVCAVEGAFYATNVKSALKLGQVRGVVLLAAARASLPVYEYSPLEIKLALVGYGHADKRQVQTMVQVLLSLDEAPHPLDASDALAVAICHAHNAIGRPEIDGPNRGPTLVSAQRR